MALCIFRVVLFGLWRWHIFSPRRAKQVQRDSGAFSLAFEWHLFVARPAALDLGAIASIILRLEVPRDARAVRSTLLALALSP